MYHSGSGPSATLERPVRDAPGDTPGAEFFPPPETFREKGAVKRRLVSAGSFAWRLGALGVGISAVLYGYQVLLGSPDPAHYPSAYAYQFPARYFAYGAILLLAATLFPRKREWAMALVLLPCLHHLYDTCPALVPCVVALVPTLYWLLGSESVPGAAATRRFWIGLFIGVILMPKLVQAVFRLDHGSWLDTNETLFAGLFLRYAYYFYERRMGLTPAGRFWEHAAYLLFIPQVTGMLNLPPSEMRGRWGFGAKSLRRGFASVGWAALKIPCVVVLGRDVLPRFGYHRGYDALRAAPRWALWTCLLASYLYWLILVSAKFDLMVALFRFFGVNVDDNFNWPLLATSPVDLWRRWNIYNRRLLLKFVYFPLGGNRRRVYRNIMATFLASALLLHTGFMGSPWLWVDPAQLRDWLLYFALQGLLVCGAYWWLGRSFWGKLPPVWRWPLRMAGWGFTLLSAAWLHTLPLAAGNFLNDPSAAVASLGQRVELMLRALGAP